ncbi:hypothetical protein Hypma_011908 [Hypsizygus marmoreus]|uniref:Uncharacterized protein n=1 Tax=Hypsizygus marmoreus TaxID=39966 RepID=A0A369JP86_HYPMA|nr:hypothetical protein Hypma_011908 [Hypsizygus marmoreus]
MSNLDPVDFARFSSVCRPIHEDAMSFRSRAFNINKHLAPYFLQAETEAFRRLQASTGMLISGTSALEFFLRSCFNVPLQELEVFVEHSFALQVGRWLITIGYEFIPAGPQNDEFKMAYTEASGPQGVRSYRSFKYATAVFRFFSFRTGKNVQLIAACSSPLQVILNMSSTCTMNIISHDIAVAFYPRSTFEKKESLLINYIGLPEQLIDSNDITLYEDWGWAMQTKLRLPEFTKLIRRVGDRSCWTIPLRPISYEGGRVRYPYRVTGNSWRHAFRGFRGNFMETMPVTHYNLKYTYILGCDDVVHAARERVQIQIVGEEYADELYNNEITEQYGDM